MKLVTGLLLGLLLGSALTVSAQYLDMLDPPYIKGIPLYERIDEELAFQRAFRDRFPVVPRRPCDGG